MKNKLVKLIKDNPDLEVKVLFENDYEKGCCSCLANITSVYVDKYTIIDDYFYLFGDEYGYDALCGAIGGDAIEKMSDDEFKNEVEKLNWKEVIIVSF
ncbi:hypothetical protein [Eubacterium barkeri]|uniref:Uncharacterized protein n=1 Tax=Eubacterium barkeri TaxID=1528 RepID=A0A1H3IPM3_EUBBA|nr:hypothetical protein [Eubacterium barkeri]SDY29662.1 hypothetical protein SAMN04488579_12433 [Eubacterium barkeri]